MFIPTRLAGGGALACFASAAFGGASLFMNLVVNGDAETGDDTGWSPAGVFVAAANAGSLGLPPGVSIGAFSFTAGLGEPVELIEQLIDFSNLAASIDSGATTAAIDGLVQSRAVSGLTDSALVRIRIENAAGDPLLTRVYTDTSTPNGVYDWDVFTEVVAVPVGARAVRIEIEMSRSGGASTDGFVDNLFFVLRGPGVCPGDVDGDGDIDFSDLNALLSMFNAMGPGLPGDFDNDDDVDFNDLNILLGVYNTDCP